MPADENKIWVVEWEDGTSNVYHEAQSAPAWPYVCAFAAERAQQELRAERNLLAQRVQDTGYIGCEAAGGWCRYCQKTIGAGHKEGCLVELAERILKERDNV